MSEIMMSSICRSTQLIDFYETQKQILYEFGCTTADSPIVEIGSESVSPIATVVSERMTSAALIVGCSLIAFSPAASLLFIIAYTKAHLVIVITIAAFAYLLSILLSSLVWFPFRKLLKRTSGTAAFIIPISVLIQAFFRCAFVLLYHRVEVVIQQSIEHHEQSIANNPDQQREELSDTNRLRHEINDFSSAIAGGTGFGGMHTIMMYGTFLASESGHRGTLYQSSCSSLPSLANAALIAFLFFFLDLCWMILTFYGIRMLFQKSQQSGFINGKSVIVLVIVLHMAASSVTVINEVRVDGCKLALSLLGGIVALTFIFMRLFIWDSFLPDETLRR